MGERSVKSSRVSTGLHWFWKGAPPVVLALGRAVPVPLAVPVPVPPPPPPPPCPAKVRSEVEGVIGMEMPSLRCTAWLPCRRPLDPAADDDAIAASAGGGKDTAAAGSEADESTDAETEADAEAEAKGDAEKRERIGTEGGSE